MKSHGIPRAVANPLAVPCPTCGRGKGARCARKVSAAMARSIGLAGRLDVEGWTGVAKRCHPERMTAAIAARKVRDEKSNR